MKPRRRLAANSAPWALLVPLALVCSGCFALPELERRDARLPVDDTTAAADGRDAPSDDGGGLDGLGDGLVGDGAGGDGPPNDGPSSDGPAAPCPPLDGKTLLLLDFDGAGAADDRTGKQTTSARGVAADTNGPAGCGKAASFVRKATADAYVEVADSKDWTQTAASLDFWIRVDASMSGRGGHVLGRDESGENGSGHLQIFISCDDRLVLRLLDGTPKYICSAPLSMGRWHRVGINFGAPRTEMFVDGARATFTGKTKLLVFGSDACASASAFACGAPTSATFSGNANPWVIGAGTLSSDPGKAEPVFWSFSGALDHVRISAGRRSY